MKVGLPKGLLYYKYYPFFETFFSELGAEIVTSSATNKEILNEGVKYSVDEACLPVKIFHGHVATIKDKCDLMLIPRIMQLRKKEFICPKFCGLPEMIINSIPDMPKTIAEPIYATSKKKLFKWALSAGRMITADNFQIMNAYITALMVQKNYKTGIKDENYELNIALTGHPYNLYDDFINMNIVKKLNALGVGIITEESLKDDYNNEANSLYKRPFWTFARENYGFSLQSYNKKLVDGIIYISSFNCGIDSVVIELIKDKLGDFPFLLLKVDEQTGEAGLNTRIEAFVDMLQRRVENESNISTHG